uniref:Uncharacterized protein n=1 Tax=Knipowitschia caucasica TaxID=637954 RepID=A0AAV2L818_KNICA
MRGADKTGGMPRQHNPNPTRPEQERGCPLSVRDGQPAHKHCTDTLSCIPPPHPNFPPSSQRRLIRPLPLPPQHPPLPLASPRASPALTPRCLPPFSVR